MGDMSIIRDCIVLFAAFTWVSLSSGTNWGRNALIAGAWIPEPSARTADTTNSIHMELYPSKKNMAKIRVDNAIKESDRIIKILRL